VDSSRRQRACAECAGDTSRDGKSRVRYRYLSNTGAIDADAGARLGAAAVVVVALPPPVARRSMRAQRDISSLVLLRSANKTSRAFTLNIFSSHKKNSPSSLGGPAEFGAARQADDGERGRSHNCPDLHHYMSCSSSSPSCNYKSAPMTSAERTSAHCRQRIAPNINLNVASLLPGGGSPTIAKRAATKVANKQSYLSLS
jgi:hypothetical protein